MEKFLNHIDPIIFRRTNAPWNDLKLNNPWSVGYVSALVSVHPFKNKESWEHYYYESGEQRRQEIGTFQANVQNELNDFQLALTDPTRVKFYNPSLKRYNLYRGRTRAELELKGRVLLAETKRRAPSVNIDLDTATDCVRFRTICETWNGIIVREANTVKRLESELTACRIVEVSADSDYHYAVDREVYAGDELVCAIQIKPESYHWNAPYVQHARNANAQKNAAYEKKYNVPVFTIISKSNGFIANHETLNRMKNEIRRRT